MLVSALARELDARLAGARLRGLALEREARRVLLFFREATLSFSLHPERPGVTLLEAVAPHPGARPLAARLEGAEAPPDERILRLHLRPRRRPGLLTLTLELLTPHLNAVLSEGPAGRMRSVLIPRRGERALRAGGAYLPPSPSTREGREGTLSTARWLEILGPLPPEQRRRALLSRVAWTSALSAPALLGEAAVDAGPAGEAALVRGHLLWLRLVQAVRAPEPVLLHTPERLQPYPLPLPGTQAEPVEGLLEAFRTAAAARGEAEAARLPGEWVAAAEARIERTERRARVLAAELADAPDPEALRARGDLLLARYGEVRRGARVVRLLDFEGRPVELELDPALEPHENAAACYERAARAARARERLPGLVAAAEREAGALRELLARTMAGEADPSALREALAQGSPDGPVAEGSPTLPYRSYRSSGGLEIRVGKGARSNDELTFRHAHPRDVWLHARHAAGAHVVLRWREEGSPPARDLEEAAVLAALHSRARGSGSVPVDWTRRRYVRKPRGAAPGAVVFERSRTLFVTPDPALEERLREG